MGSGYQTSNVSAPPAARTESLRILLGGIFGMMVAMGIGRFAYTPILPIMQRELGMTNAVAGWLASTNFTGYLAGAVLCAFFPLMLRSSAVNICAILASIASTFLMGATLSPQLWGLLRGVSGLSSAILFVVISIEVSEALTRRGCGHLIGALYGGIGLGIALSGSMVPVFETFGGWRFSWFGMGGLAGLLTLSGLLLARKRAAALDITAGQTTPGPRAEKYRLLAAAYICEGLGYIVSATFIVAMISRTPGLESFAPLSWVAVGLAAAPSTIFWQQVGRRIGVRPALMLAYAVQAVGILVSIRATSVPGACLAAVFFGGTFLGIVTLVMTEGNRRAGHDGRRTAAILTVCFSIGQVIGPPLAGRMADLRGGFALPLLLAALAVTIGGILVALDTEGFKRNIH
jgi:predicted MFS family arabinose efflux permease